MNLFPYEPTRNLLPFDGIANYYGPILTPCEAEDYLEALLTTVPWKSDEAIICGKHIVTARKVAWYADWSYSYTYSGTTKIALPWTRELLALKTLVEDKAQCSFNSCLCNLYHDGSEGMGWHSDDEKALGKDTAIGSLSLGAQRNSTNSQVSSKIQVVLRVILLSLILLDSVHATELWRDVHPDKEYVFEADETDIAADIIETEAVTKATDWATRFYGVSSVSREAIFGANRYGFGSSLLIRQTRQPVYAIVLPDGTIVEPHVLTRS